MPGIATAIAALITVTLTTPPGKGPPIVQLAGVLTEQGSKRCTKDMAVEWVDPHLQVGFTRLTADPAGAKALVGKPVVVTGRVDPTFRPPPVRSEGPCPVPQMRSDMVWSKSGMRMQRGERTGIQYFTPNKIRVLDEISAEHTAEGLVVTYKNPTDRDMSTVALRVHYEGCFGKPGTLSRDRRLPTLPPGETARLTVPLLLEQEAGGRGRKHYVAWSVQVTVKQAHNMYFDLDVPVHALGVDAKCPDRRGRK